MSGSAGSVIPGLAPGVRAAMGPRLTDPGRKPGVHGSR